MKKLLVIILIIISFIVMGFYFININNKIEIELVKCVDGDTAWFNINGNKEKVRFLGVDTPESTNIKEEYGKEASDYTCDMLNSANNIYIEYDINSDKRDKYDRVLGWIFVDNNNLSELLLSKGYAEVNYIYGDYKYIDKLCLMQKEAYNNRVGIWSINYNQYKDNYCSKNNY